MAKITVDPAIYFHGDFNLLNDYIMKAAACGVDFFKIQMFHPNHLAAPQWKEKKKFFEHNYIDAKMLAVIKDNVEKMGMQLSVTVNYTEAIKICHDTRISNIKIASGMVIEPLIASLAEFKWKRVFVSTGMMPDVIPLQLITWLTDCVEELIVYHCVSLYPTEYSETKLNRIYALRDHFQEFSNIEIGYSDHCCDNLACLMALGMGVKYIEKHFKVSGAFGPTIEVCADEAEMAELCGSAKQQNKILGKCDLKMHPREQESIEHYQGRYLV
jgi:sialic acid synthase SpsE